MSQMDADRNDIFFLVHLRSSATSVVKSSFFFRRKWIRAIKVPAWAKTSLAPRFCGARLDHALLLAKRQLELNFLGNLG